MGFVNKRQEEDDELPGSGLHVDLEQRVCPECRTEALPWQDVCATCGAVPVATTQLPARSFHLPQHLLDDLHEPAADGDDDADDRTGDGSPGEP